MGKAKRKSHDEVEYLKGIIREQKTEILQLKRELKSLRISKYRLDEIEELIEHSPPTPKRINCMNCGKGFMEDKPLPFGTLKICNVCGKREIIRNVNENEKCEE